MNKLTLKEKIGYGLGDTASNIVFQVVLVFMMIFYTDVFGISAAAAGTLMLVVRLFDMVTDPIMGGIADRTQTKWGKYRPYLVWVAIPYCVLAIIAFTTPDYTHSGKLLYAYITYALLMTAYTAINIPYGALGGVMTSNPNERGEIQGYRFALAMVGGLIVTSSMSYLVKQFGHGDDQHGFQYAMGVLSIIAFVCFILCFLATKERVPPESVREEPTFWAVIQGIFNDFKVLVSSNSQWALIATATFFLLIIAVLRGGATLYYTKYFLQCESDITLFLGVFTYDMCDKVQLGTAFLTMDKLLSIVGAVATIFLTRSYCKTVIFKCTALAFIISSVALYFVESNMIWTGLFFNSMNGFFHTMMIALVFAMTADSVDWGEYVYGERSTAMTFSGHLFALKLGAAIGGAMLGWILAGYGYKAPIVMVEGEAALAQAQSSLTLSGIVLLMTLFPAITAVFVYICGWLYRLTSSKLLEIQAELNQRASSH